MFDVREYHPADERGWLECRLLSFLDSSYYDDVRTDRSDIAAPNLSLVAEQNGMIVGLLDIELDGGAATIDSIAVHPRAQQQGIASALLAEALHRMPAGTKTLHAWTREDVAANGWYQRNGFEEAYRYLHVYKGYSDPNDGFRSPEGLSLPVLAFMHADIEEEESMRRAFKRVHVCRQYVRRLGPA